MLNCNCLKLGNQESKTNYTSFFLNHYKTKVCRINQKTAQLHNNLKHNYLLDKNNLTFEHRCYKM